MFFAAVLAGVALGVVSAAPLEPYSSRYEHINADMILNNKRLMTYYATCMLSKGPCPPEGLEFKRILPDAIRTNCIRCTEKQKTVTLRTIKRLMKEYPKIWSQLATIWDPKGIYVPKFIRTFDIHGLPLPTQPSPTEAAVFVIGNRFGDTEENEVASVPTTTVKYIAPPQSTSKTVNAISNTSKPTKTTTTTTPPPRPVSTTTTTNKPTKKPATTGFVNPNVRHTENLIRSIVREIYMFKLRYFNTILKGR
ncbi:unnamed protein product [Brassicogethes aeneus]|uniref:Uncharacterized protein n=1 Tax=Brassicogethes aeneus TaxID=1431903 RepID=A0A9P0ATN1_BRAAE|nr:unnamed protein product [Brassicogethes aeneus]